jgi:hypothetical protein
MSLRRGDGARTTVSMRQQRTRVLARGEVGTQMDSRAPCRTHPPAWQRASARVLFCRSRAGAAPTRVVTDSLWRRQHRAERARFSSARLPSLQSRLNGELSANACCYISTLRLLTCLLRLPPRSCAHEYTRYVRDSARQQLT